MSYELGLRNEMDRIISTNEKNRKTEILETVTFISNYVCYDGESR